MKRIWRCHNCEVSWYDSTSQCWACLKEVKAPEPEPVCGDGDGWD